jgi:hypothetical protein
MDTRGISADPVTALMIISGRLSPWPAIALMACASPGIVPKFFDLFVFPCERGVRP